MLRVRPAQLTMTVVSGSNSAVMSVIRRADSPPGDAAPAGDAEPPVFLRRAGIQNHQLVAPLHPPAQFSGVNFRDVMHHLHLFAEILAGDVDPPLGRVVPADPAVDAPGQHGYLSITEFLQSSGGQGGPAAVIVAQDYRDAGVGNRRGQPELQLPAGYQAGAGDVRTVVFPGFPNVNQGKGRVALQQGIKVFGGDFSGHNNSPPAEWLGVGWSK